MINCSIHNYKEWIGAYMDGNLSREDMLTAESFLQQHSHLMDEYLDDLETFSVDPGESITPSFSGLEIKITATANIHQNNFTEYFISYHEGLLGEVKKREVDQFLQLNPRLKSEFEVYAATRLYADHSIQHPDKRSLYKRSRPVVPLFGKIAVAASILLVAGLYVLWPSTEQKKGIALMDSSQIRSVVIPNNNLIQHSTTDQENNNLVQNEVKEKNELPVHLNKQPVHQHKNMKLVNMNINTPVLLEQSIPSVEDTQPQMALKEFKPIIITDYNEVAENKPQKRSLFDKILSGEKTYIEDYVNATFTAFSNEKEDDKWVLKVDRDKQGKSKRVKFSSPLFSAKSGN